jgi:ketosteroid isomerase-like protein
MSQQNVEVIRHAIDAYNRGDIDGFLEYWAPDAVVDWSNSRGLDARVHQGQGEIHAFVRRFRDAFEDVRIELVGEPLEVKDGLLMAENVSYMRGREGIEVQARSAWLITCQDSKQTSLTMYQTKQDALEAAGLQE